jgi:hypothetical protein
MVWFRAINADNVTMLRSRGDKSGRFHKLPTITSSVYLSSAGETLRTSSDVSAERGEFDAAIVISPLLSLLTIDQFLMLFGITRALNHDF